MKRLILLFGVLLSSVGPQAQPGYEFKQANSILENKPQQARLSWETVVALSNSNLVAALIGIVGTIIGFRLSSSKDDKRRKEDEKKRSQEKLNDLKTTIQALIFKFTTHGKQLLEFHFHYSYYHSRMLFGRERTTPGDVQEVEKANTLINSEKDKWDLVMAEFIKPIQDIIIAANVSEKESKKLTSLLQEFIDMNFHLFQFMILNLGDEKDPEERFPFIWDLREKKDGIIQIEFYEGIIYPMQKFIAALEINDEDK
ncbi:MAG: hypothetical protein IPG90_14235 [Bacteroidetes bacterium]|nr:hypothetical protein [Bacteroidota bacterium]MBP6401323.1 hypothetical protein [Bacteroidia bacterium]MBK6839268.1 hypothetical protein [Bacteroidota bacterium]MBK9543603.1 hypothetical protein [Bacteroidota bacterium]MBL0257932.1 hypothetical protein [Bacteroidota bacterium]